ncbi:MAG: ArsR/SmtB family transcription factor [Armatimonadota bacterium]
MNVEASVEALASIFKALGDPTRLAIFQMLRCCAGADSGVEMDEEGQLRPAGSLSVGEVCCRVGGSMSTISHHLKELRLAGLIRMEKRGRWIYCSVNPEVLEQVRSFAEDEETAPCQEVAAPGASACC